MDSINATRWIKQNLPGAKVSGGVSTCRSAFAATTRCARPFTQCFYHAIQAGMDMGIVNAGMVGVYDNEPKILRERVEDVVLNRVPKYKPGESPLSRASEAIGGIAETPRPDQGRGQKRMARHTLAPVSVARPLAATRWCTASPGVHCEVSKRPTARFFTTGGRPAVIEGPLMAGMNVVGDLFRRRQRCFAPGGQKPPA